MNRLRLESELWDWASRSSLVRRVRFASALISHSLPSRSVRQRLHSALAKARMAYGSEEIDEHLGDLAEIGAELRSLSRQALRAMGSETIDNAIEHAAILKLPRGKERGVLVVCFEHNFNRLLQHADIDRLCEDYTLLVSPTWSPPFEPALSLLAAAWPAPIVTMLSNMADESIFPQFVPGISVVPLLASSWVHREYMAPRVAAERKSVDVVMFGNFARYKRHIALFKALADLPASLSVRLVGVPLDGRDDGYLRSLLRSYGVRQQVEIIQRAPQQTVAQLLSESRVAVIPSLREGSCIAAAELMMLDVPVIMLEGAHVGSMKFVTKDTGRVTRESSLAETIADTLTNLDDMHPRKAMLEGGYDCEGSTRTLNRFLKTHAQASGEAWTVDCIAHTIVQLTPRYTSADSADRFRQTAAEFEQRYGVRIPEPRVVPII